MATMDKLVKQVQQLENATTDLLDATNVNKKTLDEAVDSAKGSAGSASTDADTASSKAGESVTARNEAVKAKDDAKAIVYESEATLTPTPGSIPIADSNAKIDNGWLPFGEVNNPYSGVIGSVNKTTLFSFYRNDLNDTGWSDLLILNDSIQFNVNGRLIQPPKTWINLPEAESTADRAIAFDDVFIDWNGNIDNYRSITPHRTNTGYDADKIADEHGYSKVSNGLYKTGDTYALLLCRVARRNKGVHEPQLNLEGTRHSLDVTGRSRRQWYHSDLVSGRFTTLESCFISISDGGGMFETSGSTAQSDINQGHPALLRYDAIYSNDVTPLYFSAAKVTDRQALLFDSFNKAVAGETFSGAEGAYSSPVTTCRNSSSALYASEFYNSPPPIGTEAYVVFRSNDGATLNEGVELNTFYKVTTTQHEDPYGLFIRDGQVRPWIIAGGMQQLTAQVYGRNTKSDLSTARPQFLAVDIIGSLDAMPQEWLDNGLPGNWLAVGEEGEDLIPDGTEKNFKLSRKCLECYLVLKTTNGGESWVTVDSYVPDFESASNSTIRSLWETDCLMIFYRTAANPFELADVYNYLELGRNPLALNGGNQAAISKPSLTERMIGKVPVSSSSSWIGDDEAYGIIHYGGNSISDRRRLYSNRVMHQPFSGNRLAPQNPCAKHIPTLIGRYDVYNLQVVYKELRYSNKNWGDDNRFNAVSNQSTVTDLNGEQVIVGQKRTALPYHFGETY